MSFQIRDGFLPIHRPVAARLFWEAFSRKLSSTMNPPEKAMAFFEDVMDPGHAISAVDQDGRLLGLAGFKSPDGAFIGGTFSDLARFYGTFGALWRGPVLALLEREVDGKTLLMDGIFVAEEARGQGIGSALLSAICERARTMALSGVRLDVIDSNPRARALYERKGFREVAQSHLGPLRHVFGFKSATTMLCPVS